MLSSTQSSEPALHSTLIIFHYFQAPPTASSKCAFRLSLRRGASICWRRAPKPTNSRVCACAAAISASSTRGGACASKRQFGGLGRLGCERRRRTSSKRSFHVHVYRRRKFIARFLFHTSQCGLAGLILQESLFFSLLGLYYRRRRRRSEETYSTWSFHASHAGG